jgi:hypothetical protein
MPEGYINEHIDDFVAVLNTNTRTVTGNLRVYYTDGESQTYPVSFPPEQRSGVVMRFTGVKWNQPYGMALETDLPVTAALLHYDYEKKAALGEHFSPTLSREWSVAEGYMSNWTRDYLTLLNPNNTTVEARVNLFYRYRPYPPLPQYFDIRIKPNSRFRLDFHEFLSDYIWRREYGFTLQAEQPVSVALSHYDENWQDGSLIMGTPSILGSHNAYVAHGVSNNSFEVLNILNPHSFSVDLDVILHYPDGISQVFSYLGIGSESRQGLDISQLDATDSHIGYAIEYRAYASHYNYGDDKAPTGGTPVAVITNYVNLSENAVQGSRFTEQPRTYWEFAEGCKAAGVTEYLSIYNPSKQDATVDVTVYYDDGGEIRGMRDGETAVVAYEDAKTTFSINIPAGDWQRLAMHEQANIRSREGSGMWYGIAVSASQPVIPKLQHSDSLWGGSMALDGVPR